MDPFALLGIMAISAALAYVAAMQKYARQLRMLQQRVFSVSLESTSKCISAAMTTLVEDYKVEPAEAEQKLFARCVQAGMVLRKIDPQTGESTPVTTEAPKS
jgi:hypothetical protein